MAPFAKFKLLETRADEASWKISIVIEARAQHVDRWDIEE